MRKLIAVLVLFCLALDVPMIAAPAPAPVSQAQTQAPTAAQSANCLIIAAYQRDTRFGKGMLMSGSSESSADGDVSSDKDATPAMHADKMDEADIETDRCRHTHISTDQMGTDKNVAGQGRYKEGITEAMLRYDVSSVFQTHATYASGQIQATSQKTSSMITRSGTAPPAMEVTA